MTPERLPPRAGRSPIEREPIVPEPEPGNRPAREPDTEQLLLLPKKESFLPDAESPLARREGTASDPDF